MGCTFRNGLPIAAPGESGVVALFKQTHMAVSPLREPGLIGGAGMTFIISTHLKM